MVLPLACVLASEPLGASMFIAAFVAGLATQAGFRDVGRHSVEFAEDWGQLFNLAVFFLFGLLVARAWTQLTPAALLYAALSLTAVRMLPVWMPMRTCCMPASTSMSILSRRQVRALAMTPNGRPMRRLYSRANRSNCAGERWKKSSSEKPTNSMHPNFLTWYSISSRVRSTPMRRSGEFPHRAWYRQLLQYEQLWGQPREAM